VAKFLENAFLDLTTTGAKPSNPRKRIGIRRRTFATARFFAPSGPAHDRIDLAGKKKGRTEFRKEYRKVEEQAATIEQQERRLTELARAVAKF